MTPKEKAQELVNEMLQNVQAVDQYNLQLGSMNLYNAKQCALIVVDELIKSRKDDYQFDDSKYASPSSSNYSYYVPHPMYSTYWNQVKTEIEKL